VWRIKTVADRYLKQYQVLYYDTAGKLKYIPVSVISSARGIESEIANVDATFASIFKIIYPGNGDLELEKRLKGFDSRLSKGRRAERDYACKDTSHCLECPLFEICKLKRYLPLSSQKKAEAVKQE
jgi:hypothetical protein